ncbi:MAG: PadR family transcriptional regulator [Anaerolineales bacterium]|jgi:DNA-binding PadR family transcriptional regulator
MLKHTLLGMLSQEPRHGYDLKNAFEALLGGTWPLNIGQVYTTLNRLERDALVKSEVVPQDLLPDRKVYAITQDGRDELDQWLREPATDTIRLKDEFFIKILVHQIVGSEEVLPLIRKQMQIHMQKMAQLISLRSDTSLDPSTILLIEGAILHIEADLQWLGLCEERLKE